MKQDLPQWPGGNGNKRWWVSVKKTAKKLSFLKDRKENARFLTVGRAPMTSQATKSSKIYVHIWLPKQERNTERGAERREDEERGREGEGSGGKNIKWDKMLPVHQLEFRLFRIFLFCSCNFSINLKLLKKVKQLKAKKKKKATLFPSFKLNHSLKAYSPL